MTILSSYKLAQRPLLIVPLGIIFGFIYFTTSYYIIKLLRLNLLGDIDDKGANSSAMSSRALDFIEALGGRENIISTSAGYYST